MDTGQQEGQVVDGDKAPQDGQASDAGDVPMLNTLIIQCSACRSIIGDTVSFIGATEELGTISLKSSLEPTSLGGFGPMVSINIIESTI
jgi:hypothetical protein